MKTVYIIDSNYPVDHYLDRADGAITQNILKALGIKADLRLALDREYFKKAVTRATKAGCNVLHISTHGDEDGILVCTDSNDPRSKLPQGYIWKEFVGLFQGPFDAPDALVMSACKAVQRCRLGRSESSVQHPGTEVKRLERRRIPESEIV